MSAGAVAIGDLIFLLVGYSVDNKRNESILTRVDVFDPKRHTWRRGSDLPKKLLFSGIAAIDNSIFVIGGWDKHNRPHPSFLKGYVILIRLRRNDKWVRKLSPNRRPWAAARTAFAAYRC
jgi:hypothetical protein